MKVDHIDHGYAAYDVSISEFARLTGLSRNSVYKYLRIVEES